jgi:hypothetical protein
MMVRMLSQSLLGNQETHMSLNKVLVSSLTALALMVGLFAAPAPARAQSGIIIDSVDLDGVAIVDGVVTATGGTVTGTFAGLPFTTDIEDFSIDLLPDSSDGACSILNLELAPIDLDVLGLHVDTSAICLELTAYPDEGLLGQLLCGIAGGNLLGLQELLDLLPGILTEALASEPEAPAADAEDICDGECEILDLAVGPVDLTLLGLNVYLHNCEDGPVQVCVSASSGQGLLGDLLCGLAGGDILPDLGQLLDIIEALDDLLDLEVTNLGQINRLISLVSRLLQDGALSGNELNSLEQLAGKIARLPRQALRN